MKLFLRTTFFLIAITALAPFASGQTYWAGGVNASASVGNTPATTDNNFNTANNWSTVPPNFLETSGTPVVPGINDIAVVQADLNDGAIQDDFLTGTATVPVLINQISQGNTLQGLLVSNVLFTGGIVTISNSAAQPLTIAGTNTSTGDLLVDGGVTLNYGGGPLAVTNGTIVIGDNNDNFFFNNSNNIRSGSGTFNITSSTFTFDASGTTTKMYVGRSSVATGVTTFGTATGTVTQGAAASGASPATASTVTLGSTLVIGYNGGTGTWNVTNGSLLQTGSLASSYKISLGSNGGAGGLNGTGGSGTLMIDSTSTFNLGRSGSGTSTSLQLGTTDPNAPTLINGGSGTIIQNGTVNMAGTATTVDVGGFGSFGGDGGTGTYRLQGGTLNVGANSTDVVSFILGAGTNSNGFLTQTAGILNVGNSTVANGTTFTVGTVGNGTYNLNGGTANFYNALTLGANGTLNLNGGILNITAAHITASAPGVGFLNFGGGTLMFAASATTTYTDNFGGGTLATNTVSTIDASASSLTSVIFANPLSGGGGINFIGNGATVFSFTNGTANSYNGPTSITSGTLDVSGADITHSSALNMGTGGIANVTLATNGLGYTGSIGGTGNLNINFTTAGNTFAIQNASSFTGVITVGASGTPGILQVFSGTYGVIGDNGSGSGVTIGGSLPAGINNAFQPPASGTVTFAASPTYTGLTTVSQNFTLNTPSLAGSATVGSVPLPGGTLNVTGVGGIGGNLTNNGGLVTVTSAAGIVGNVTDNTGIIMTPLVQGNVQNDVGGTFITTSAINTTSVGGTVTNNGILASNAPLVPVAPLATPNATFTIGGNLNQSATGIMNVRVLTNTADYYQINGTANLAGTLGVSGSTALGNNTFVVVNATGGVSAGTLTTSDDTALFRSVVGPITANTVSITTTQLPVALYAQTPNQQAVAGAIDSAAGSSLKTAFNQISIAAAPGFFPAVLDQLSPESLQYARMISFENSTLLALRADGWCSDLRSGYGGLDTNAVSVVTPGFNSGLGRSLGSFFASDDSAFHSSAPNGVNYYPGGSSSGTGEDNTSSPSSSSTPSSSSAPAWDSSTQVISDSPNPYMANQNPSSTEMPARSEFIAGDVVLADLNQNQSGANAPSSKASYTAGDVTAGVSFRMNSHLAAGVLFDYNHTDAKTDSSGSSTKVDSYSPGVFATYFDHGFYVNGLASFGYNTYSNSRAISLLGETATSHPSGQQYVGDLDVGYDFHPARNWVVGPTLGVTYTHLDIDSFTETSAPGADLDVASQSADSLRSRLGGHILFQTNTGDVLLQPTLTAMWQHEYMDDSSGITSTFNDFSSSPFTIETAEPSRDSALIGCGLSATLSTSMELYLEYLADVGASDYFAQSVVGGFKARF